MLERYLQGIRATFLERRLSIDELHFVYKRLLRLLPNIARYTQPPLDTVLPEQHAMDRTISSELVTTAVEHGHVPGPCTCEEAAELTDQLHRVAHTAPRPQRVAAVVNALRMVRLHLIRTWARLLVSLPEDVLPGLRKMALDMQRKEAEQHRQLVTLSDELASREKDLGRRTG